MGRFDRLYTEYMSSVFTEKGNCFMLALITSLAEMMTTANAVKLFTVYTELKNGALKIPDRLTHSKNLRKTAGTGSRTVDPVNFNLIEILRALLYMS